MLLGKRQHKGAARNQGLLVGQADVLAWVKWRGVGRCGCGGGGEAAIAQSANKLPMTPALQFRALTSCRVCQFLLLHSPALMAATVGLRPAQPTMPVTQASASACAATAAGGVRPGVVNTSHRLGTTCSCCLPTFFAPEDWPCLLLSTATHRLQPACLPASQPAHLRRCPPRPPAPRAGGAHP